MKLGVFTPLLSQLPLDGVLEKLSTLDIHTVELGTGNYPSDAHCSLSMLDDATALSAFQKTLARHEAKTLERMSRKIAVPFPTKASCGILKRYPAITVLSEFCILRRIVAQIVQENLLAVNLSYLVPDLAKVDESLDEEAQAALVTLAEQATANAQASIR